MRKPLLPITRDNDLKVLYGKAVGKREIQISAFIIKGYTQYLAKGMLFTMYYNQFRYYYRPVKPITRSN